MKRNFFKSLGVITLSAILLGTGTGFAMSGITANADEPGGPVYMSDVQAKEIFLGYAGLNTSQTAGVVRSVDEVSGTATYSFSTTSGAISYYGVVDPTHGVVTSYDVDANDLSSLAVPSRTQTYAEAIQIAFADARSKHLALTGSFFSADQASVTYTLGIKGGQDVWEVGFTAGNLSYNYVILYYGGEIVYADVQSGTQTTLGYTGSTPHDTALNIIYGYFPVNTCNRNNIREFTTYYSGGVLVYDITVNYGGHIYEYMLNANGGGRLSYTDSYSL